MKKEYRFLLFIAVNFLALYIGSFLSQNGPSSDWYQSLNKAPWTPPGWVFGTAWSMIMICFSLYLAYLFDTTKKENTGLILFMLQLVLNISWNPIFFYFNNITMALINLVLLFVLTCSIFILFLNRLKWKSLLLSPYIIWLLLAISLNLYLL